MNQYLDGLVHPLTVHAMDLSFPTVAALALVVIAGAGGLYVLVYALMRKQGGEDLTAWGSVSFDDGDLGPTGGLDVERELDDTDGGGLSKKELRAQHRLEQKQAAADKRAAAQAERQARKNAKAQQRAEKRVKTLPEAEAPTPLTTAEAAVGAPAWPTEDNTTTSDGPTTSPAMDDSTTEQGPDWEGVVVESKQEARARKRQERADKRAQVAAERQAAHQAQKDARAAKTAARRDKQADGTGEATSHYTDGAGEVTDGTSWEASGTGEAAVAVEATQILEAAADEGNGTADTGWVSGAGSLASDSTPASAPVDLPLPSSSDNPPVETIGDVADGVPVEAGWAGAGTLDWPDEELAELEPAPRKRSWWPRRSADTHEVGPVESVEGDWYAGSDWHDGSGPHPPSVESEHLDWPTTAGPTTAALEVTTDEAATGEVGAGGTENGETEAPVEDKAARRARKRQERAALRQARKDEPGSTVVDGGMPSTAVPGTEEDGQASWEPGWADDFQAHEPAAPTWADRDDGLIGDVFDPLGDVFGAFPLGGGIPDGGAEDPWGVWRTRVESDRPWAAPAVYEIAANSHLDAWVANGAGSSEGTVEEQFWKESGTSRSARKQQRAQQRAARREARAQARQARQVAKAEARQERARVRAEKHGHTQPAPGAGSEDNWADSTGFDLTGDAASSTLLDWPATDSPSINEDSDEAVPAAEDNLTDDSLTEDQTASGGLESGIGQYDSTGVPPAAPAGESFALESPDENEGWPDQPVEPAPKRRWWQRRAASTPAEETGWTETSENFPAETVTAEALTAEAVEAVAVEGAAPEVTPGGLEAAPELEQHEPETGNETAVDVEPGAEDDKAGWVEQDGPPPLAAMLAAAVVAQAWDVWPDSSGEPGGAGTPVEDKAAKQARRRQERAAKRQARKDELAAKKAARKEAAAAKKAGHGAGPQGLPTVVEAGWNQDGSAPDDAGAVVVDGESEPARSLEAGPVNKRQAARAARAHKREERKQAREAARLERAAAVALKRQQKEEQRAAAQEAKMAAAAAVALQALEDITAATASANEHTAPVDDTSAEADIEPAPVGPEMGAGPTAGDLLDPVALEMPTVENEPVAPVAPVTESVDESDRTADLEPVVDSGPVEPAPLFIDGGEAVVLDEASKLSKWQLYRQARAERKATRLALKDDSEIVPIGPSAAEKRAEKRANREAARLERAQERARTRQERAEQREAAKAAKAAGKLDDTQHQMHDDGSLSWEDDDINQDTPPASSLPASLAPAGGGMPVADSDNLFDTSPTDTYVGDAAVGMEAMPVTVNDPNLPAPAASFEDIEDILVPEVAPPVEQTALPAPATSFEDYQVVDMPVPDGPGPVVYHPVEPEPFAGHDVVAGADARKVARGEARRMRAEAHQAKAAERAAKQIEKRQAREAAKLQKQAQQEGDIGTGSLTRAEKRALRAEARRQKAADRLLLREQKRGDKSGEREAKTLARRQQATEREVARAEKRMAREEARASSSTLRKRKAEERQQRKLLQRGEPVNVPGAGTIDVREVPDALSYQWDVESGYQGGDTSDDFIDHIAYDLPEPLPPRH
jgi:hypothetical protein